jgi:predicted ATPase/signal transduction histidine kinase/PAS domain-containing protein
MIELSTYVFDVLRKDEEVILYRGRNKDDASQVLVLSPVAEYPTLESLKRLEHEYSFREELDPAWAARPIAMARHWDRTVLVMEDPGSLPLDRLLGQPLSVAFSLRLAISLSSAIGQLHQRGIVHKDLKPANVLVNSSGQVWLTGFGIASRLPRERQAPEAPEFIAGTFAYMAPEQTGRMNRSIDSRSDLYSLGVILYQLFTGSLPFTAIDPMEWVHCHIARLPEVPAQRMENIPKAVSAIIMKLLAKGAEERYQTAAGVENDLRRCLTEWETRGCINDFVLGADDTPDRLLIPEKLYGRAREINNLVASFDRVVASGRPELVLVSGYSGIGKSSVVSELHKVLVPPRGLFASGKFDQYKRDIPYSTLVQAFQSLVRPLLGKNDAELAIWRDAFLEALDPNARLMTDLIPELKLIIGDQPPVPELEPQQAQSRFQLVFRRFIGVFARPNHPLALFLDDLQWLDAATLDLLEDLLARSDLQYLMLIGAYRDNEVDAAHPLTRKLDAMHRAGARTQESRLTPLARDDLEQLITDALRCEPADAAPLAQLVHEKTAGNPFFVIQFLYALAEEGLLCFDHGRARWCWDLGRIHDKGFTDNVVDLMLGKLARLPVETQQALQLLACLGNVAGLAMLSIVLGIPKEQVHATLWPAVRQELVQHLKGSYKFVHDRVQEAAYSLIAEASRAEAHLRIGRLLVAQTPPENREEAIFEIVNQLNRGAALITEQEERDQLAELNLIAGKRAKGSTAYASALTYLNAGAALLTEDTWEHRRELIFVLELNRAECEFLTGALAAAEQRLNALSTRAATTIERASVSSRLLDLYTTIGQSSRGVTVGLEYLRHLGVDWSPHPTDEDVRREYERFWKELGNRTIEDLIELPLMTDPASLATMDVLTNSPSAFLREKNLYALAMCWAANLSLEQGNSDGSCATYIQFGCVAGMHFGDYESAYRFGRLGCELVERRSLTRFQARTYLAAGCHLIPYAKHVRTARDLLRRGFEIASKSGDLMYMGWYRGFYLIENLLAAGDPLIEVQREAELGLAFAHQMRLGHVIDVIPSFLGLVRMLQGLTSKFGSFNDDQFDEAQTETRLASNPDFALAECLYHLRKLQAYFHAGDFAAAIHAASRAERSYPLALRWMFTAADYHFYTALSYAASCDSAPAGERQQHLDALAAHHRQLQAWAENCPENFETRAALVGAEIARIEGRELDAERLYEQAIRSARANGFVHNEAIANELAARFYTARGFEQIAHLYLRNARHCYLSWGADGKVRQLDELYPYLREEEPIPGRTSTIGAPVEHLDLATVIKVSHAISGEIVLHKLIDKLMRIALEQAGAERALLVLARGNEQRIEAEASSGRGQVTVHFRRSLVTPSELPESLLRYVVRTRESVTLDDASIENLFSEDEYIRQKRPRSVFCLPLIKQGELVGVLHLENNLAARVFTPDRLATLELIASQAAISLEQARLYAELSRTNKDLQSEINERKRAEEELRRSEAFLAQGQRISHTGSWGWQVSTGAVYWSEEHFRIFEFDPRTDNPSYSLFMERIHPEDRSPFEELLNRAVRDQRDFENQYRIVLPDGSIKFLQSAAQAVINPSGELEFIGTVMDVTDLKRAEEMQIAIAREREMLVRQRALDLAKANEALRSCLDALASIPDLDQFVGQVMAVMTGQLGAASAALALFNGEHKTSQVELLFQDGRVISPVEANYPEHFRSTPVQEEHLLAMLSQPITIIHLSDPQAPGIVLPDGLRDYFLEEGVGTLLIVPLISHGEINGFLSLRFAEKRDFQAEELEIARALATQASLAIQLTQLAKTAERSAVLEERTHLAGEIHDSLAQNFAGICMQLAVAVEESETNSQEILGHIERALDLAKFGLSEARRSAFSLRSNIIEESGLVEALKMLIERSHIPGRVRCTFHSNLEDDESLPIAIRQDLLRIAQEAISNALRHATPTAISVTLRLDPSSLVLEIDDNGCGINTSAETREGFGLVNIRARVKKLNGSLEIRSAPGRGTSILVTVPLRG